MEGGASTEPRGPGLVRRGGELELGRASRLAPESGSRRPHSKAFGGLVRRGAAVGLWGECRAGDRRAGWRGLVRMRDGGVGTGFVSRWWRKRDRGISAESGTEAVGVEVEGRAARNRRREE